jgi:hypothetical protein
MADRLLVASPSGASRHIKTGRILPIPMIDAYAAAGTFADKHQLAVDLATAVMTIEQVPDIPMFRKNTAAYVHDRCRLLGQRRR